VICSVFDSDSECCISISEGYGLFFLYHIKSSIISLRIWVLALYNTKS